MRLTRNFASTRDSLVRPDVVAEKVRLALQLEQKSRCVATLSLAACGSRITFLASIASVLRSVVSCRRSGRGANAEGAAARKNAGKDIDACLGWAVYTLAEVDTLIDGYGTQLLAFLGVGLRRESPSSVSPVWPLWLWSSAKHGEAIGRLHITSCTWELLSVVSWKAVPTPWHRIHAREGGKFSQLDRARLGGGLLYYSINKISVRSPFAAFASVARTPLDPSSARAFLSFLPLPSHLSSLFLPPFSLSSPAREVSTETFSALAPSVPFLFLHVARRARSSRINQPSTGRPTEGSRPATGAMVRSGGGVGLSLAADSCMGRSVRAGRAERTASSISAQKEGGVRTRRVAQDAGSYFL